MGRSPQETPYIGMGMRLREAAEPTYTQASATPTTPTQPGFAQPHSRPRPAFSNACRLLASTHGAAQPPRRLQPRLARAPAGHRSPIERGSFRPLNHRPPPLLRSSRSHRVPTGSAVPTDGPRSHSSAAQPCISPREAPPKSAIPPKPAGSDSAHAYRVEAEASPRDDYTYAMHTVKDG